MLNIIVKNPYQDVTLTADTDRPYSVGVPIWNGSKAKVRSTVFRTPLTSSRSSILLKWPSTTTFTSESNSTFRNITYFVHFTHHSTQQENVDENKQGNQADLEALFSMGASTSFKGSDVATTYPTSFSVEAGSHLIKQKRVFSTGCGKKPASLTSQGNPVPYKNLKNMVRAFGLPNAKFEVIGGEGWCLDVSKGKLLLCSSRENSISGLLSVTCIPKAPC